MKHLKAQIVVAVMAVLLLLTVGCQSGGPAGSDEPIKIAINEWTGQHVTAHYLGNLFEKAGYQVEYVTTGAMPQFRGLADGSITVQPEIWTNNVSELYPEAVADGRIIEVGALGLNNREGWAYPKYMEKQCPGLPSMQALIDCADLFTTAETGNNGRIFAYPTDWGTRSIYTVAALNLPFLAIPAGSEEEQIAEIQAAVAAKAPLVMMFWQPHWIHSQVEMGWVEIEPAYDPACLEDPAWGPNPDATYDCGFEQAVVTKGAWAQMEKKWPGAFSILKSFQLDGKEQDKMVVKIDQDGEDLEEVVDEWMAANEDLWKAWVDPSN